MIAGEMQKDPGFRPSNDFMTKIIEGALHERICEADSVGWIQPEWDLRPFYERHNPIGFANNQLKM